MQNIESSKQVTTIADFHHEQKGDPSRYFLAIWALAIGAVAFFVALYANFLYGIRVPFQDEWAAIEDLSANHGVYSFSLLWAQHNEHRVPFIKLLIMADLYLFKGRNISLYIESYLLQFAHALFWVWAMRRTAHWPKWMTAAGAGLTIFALFWILQWESFLTPFGLSVLAAYTGVTIAVFALIFGTETPARFSPWIGLSVVAALMSELNLANGLLLWPLLLVLAARLRLRARPLVCLAILAALAISVFLYGYHSYEGHASPMESLKKPKLISDYLLNYFGACWFSVNQDMGKTFAALGMAAAPIFYFKELFRRNVNAFALGSITIAVFLLGTGFITSLGRLHFPLMQARSSRYETSALLFWLCLGLYLADAACRAGGVYPRIVLAAALVLNSAVLPSLATSLNDAKVLSGQVDAASLPILADVRDDPQSYMVILAPGLIAEGRPLLKEHKTAFYGDPFHELLGKRLASVFFSTAPDRCLGAVDTTRLVPDSQRPGWELMGWAWDRQARRRVDSIVAVTDGETISGLGVSGSPRPDVPNALKEVTDPAIGWRAYVQGSANFKAVQLYGVVDGGKAACLVQTISVPKA